MNIYQVPEVFDSLKTFILDESALEPLQPSLNSGPKLFGETNGMYGQKHTDKTKRLMSKIKQGKISARDEFGNNIIADKTDPRWKTGQLVGINSGKSITKRKVYNLISPSNIYQLDFYAFVKMAQDNKLCLASLYSTIKTGKTTKQGWKLEVFDLIQK